MKKVVLGIVVMLMMVGNGMAYTTYDEANNAATTKWQASDYLGARLAFLEAEKLAETITDPKMNIGQVKSNAVIQAAHCYVKANDFANALIEYQKIILRTDILTGYKTDAWEGVKGFGIVAINPDWAKVVTALSSATDIVGKYYLSKSKIMAGDKTGGFDGFKALFAIEKPPLDILQLAFKDIISMQGDMITDWSAHVKWMTDVALAIPSTNQSYADFAGMIISERDKIKKIQGIP